MSGVPGEPLSSIPTNDPAAASTLAEAIAALEAKLSAQGSMIEAQSEAMSAQNQEIQNLKEQIRETMAPSDPETVHYYARRWRVLLILGRISCPALGIASMLINNDNIVEVQKLAWAAVSFLEFGCTCFFAAGMGNVRACNKRSEMTLVVLCGLGVGLCWLLSGCAVYLAEENENVTYLTLPSDFDFDLIRSEENVEENVVKAKAKHWGVGMIVMEGFWSTVLPFYPPKLRRCGAPLKTMN